MLRNYLGGLTKSWLTGNSGDVPVAVSASSTHIYYLSLHSALLTGYKTKVTQLDILTGKQTAQTTLATESEITSKDSIIHVGSATSAPLLIWTDSMYKSLKINMLGHKQITTVNIANKDSAGIESITVHAPRVGKALAHFLVHYQTSNSHWAEVYHVDVAKGTAKIAFELPKLDGHGAFSTSTVDANVYFTRNTNSEVILISSASHGILEKWLIITPSPGKKADPEGVSHAVSEVVSRGGSRFAVRSALTLPYGDWVLIRNGDPVWVRPESLAGVITVAFADIPSGADLAQELAVESHDNVLAAYIHRVRRHARDLRAFPAWLQKIPTKIIGSFMGDKPGSQDQPLQRDGFGFRKIVILATEKGRIAALDAGHQGRFIWSVQAAKIPPGSRWNVTGIEIEGDMALVLVAGGEGMLIETMTGQMKAHPLGTVRGSAELYFPVQSPQGTQSFISILPDGTPNKVAPHTIGKSVTMVTRKPSGSITGWILKDGAERAQVWEFSPAPGEEITGLTRRPPHDPVASIGKVLGDRNVLYKYLSPNLLLVTAANVAASTVSIYLLDTITGLVLFATTHSGVDTSSPIPMTFAENWFAYSVFSDPSLPSGNSSIAPLPKAHQLIITELYESPLPNDRGPLGSATNFSSLNNLAFPHALSAAYVIPAAISHLTTTSTLQGITPRALLATIPSLAALISIPLAFLSARRPVGRDPTPAEQEEGLFRYTPQLEFNPHWIISHRREVLGLQGVTSTPTLMESTSAVVAWGEVDVFGTRVSPIGAFDTLGRGFSRVQLVGTVLALGLGTAVLRPMVRLRDFLLCKVT